MTVPERYSAPCALCGGPVDIRPGHSAYREARGWEPIRTGGGGNALMLREPSGRFAHGVCLEVERVKPKTWTQLSLLDDDE